MQNNMKNEGFSAKVDKDDPYCAIWTGFRPIRLQENWSVPVAINNLTYSMWKKFVPGWIKPVAFLSPTKMCSTNKKSCLL